MAQEVKAVKGKGWMVGGVACAIIGIFILLAGDIER
jgi:hypothetical protein